MTFFVGTELRAVYDLGHEIGDEHFEGTAAVSAYIIEAMRKHFARLDDDTFKAIFYLEQAVRRGDPATFKDKPNIKVNKNGKALTVNVTVANPVLLCMMTKLSFCYRYPDDLDELEEGRPVRLSEADNPNMWDRPRYTFVHETGDFDELIVKAYERIIFAMEVEMVGRKVKVERLVEDYERENRLLVGHGQVISQMRPARRSSQA